MGDGCGSTSVGGTLARLKGSGSDDEGEFVSLYIRFTYTQERAQTAEMQQW